MDRQSAEVQRLRSKGPEERGGRRGGRIRAVLQGLENGGDSGVRGPSGICAYCGVKGHYRTQCSDLTANFNAQQVRIWKGDFYFPGAGED
ncbi:hypothetical protein VP01_10793g1 [Puccinia sorghi]|uniref:CCHC-type domain-containing protein n=1 Tax=Puccinia sorghi TaxID=27349 RepID=A0A0L6VTP4_9BASI|nr:hypothetical protein VP01_10793g1 [Puccinia sorghi]